MAKTPMNPELSLPFVEASTVAQIDQEPVSISALRDQFSANHEATYSLRRNATLSFPDLEQREKAVLLALNHLRLFDSQMAKNGLTEIFALEPAAETLQHTSDLPPAA
jgi:hypothetical protein